MKRLTLLAILSSSLSFGQNFKEIRIKDENGTRILQDATIDLANNELIFINPQGNKSFTPLDKFEKIEYRKGSYWLMGMLGGMAGGFLVKAVLKKPDEEIWYGAGPFMLAGALAGAGLGAMTPRFKPFEKSNQSLTIGFNSITYQF